jgi:hypothetical protein
MGNGIFETAFIVREFSESMPSSETRYYFKYTNVLP